MVVKGAPISSISNTKHTLNLLAKTNKKIGGGGGGGKIRVAQGRFQKKIKGSSFVGVAATPLKPLPIASCYRVKQRGTSYRVLDMYM